MARVAGMEPQKLIVVVKKNEIYFLIESQNGRMLEPVNSKSLETRIIIQMNIFEFVENRVEEILEGRKRSFAKNLVCNESLLLWRFNFLCVCVYVCVSASMNVLV